MAGWRLDTESLSATRYRVSECSGVDSGRVGVVVQYNRDLWWSIPGTYFEVRKGWHILRDAHGEYFSMHKDRLTQVPASTPPKPKYKSPYREFKGRWLTESEIEKLR